MPTLRELKGQLIAYREETREEMFARGASKPAALFVHVDALSEAHGVRFICPKSYDSHGGVVGAHSVQVYFASSPVPVDMGVNKDGKPVRWNASGKTIDDLSLTPSIQEEDNICGWHGFVGSSGVPAGSAA
jgi:hypothetical protein